MAGRALNMKTEDPLRSTAKNSSLSLTSLVPVTMTNVTTDDFLVASDSLQANDLNITSG
jgi:hypothetical protein